MTLSGDKFLWYILKASTYKFILVNNPILTLLTPLCRLYVLYRLREFWLWLQDVWL